MNPKLRLALLASTTVRALLPAPEFVAQHAAAKARVAKPAEAP